MKKLVFLGLLLLAGCRGNLVGPFEHRKPERVDDPRYDIAEQERRGRSRLALPEDSRTGAPASGAEVGPATSH